MNWNCCLQYLLQLLRQAFIFPLTPSLSRLNVHWEAKALCNASAGICLFHLNCCLFCVESVSPLRLQNTTDDVFPPVFVPQPLLLLLWWDCFRFHCEGTMQQHASAFPPEPPPLLKVRVSVSKTPLMSFPPVASLTVCPTSLISQMSIHTVCTWCSVAHTYSTQKKCE